MIVSELRKALKGINGKLEVFTQDHDHNAYETNGNVGSVNVVDQKNMTDYEEKTLDDTFRRKGKYVTIRIG